MTIHYHGTPITPNNVLETLVGRNFCVSFHRPCQVKIAHQIGQSVMLDNGAFSAWKLNKPVQDWQPYYDWVDYWCRYVTTWAVIPDVIDGTEKENDYLLCEWYARIGHLRQAAPVWHLHESFDRLLRLYIGYDRICFGSSGKYSQVGAEDWMERVSEAFDVLQSRLDLAVPIHVLRGMQTVKMLFPFASVDSSDIARHHNEVREKYGRSAVDMANRWDMQQCLPTWEMQSNAGKQLKLWG